MSREDECDPECVSNIIQLWIEGILIPTIAVFGILGNIFCLFILSNKSVELKPSFANLLKCLSVYDTALLVSWLLLLMIKEGFIKSLIFSSPPLSGLRLVFQGDENIKSPSQCFLAQVGMLLLYSLPCLSTEYRQEVKPRLTPFLLPLTQVALTGSLYTVVMVACERYQNIRRPFSHNDTVTSVPVLSCGS